MAAAVLRLLRGESNRCPKLIVALQKIKIRGHHADYRVALTIERDGLIYDCRIAAKPPLPQAVTQDHDIITPRLIFFERKFPTNQRPHAEHLTKIIVDSHAAQ